MKINISTRFNALKIHRKKLKELHDEHFLQHFTAFLTKIHRHTSTLVGAKIETRKNVSFFLFFSSTWIAISYFYSMEPFSKVYLLWRKFLLLIFHICDAFKDFDVFVLFVSYYPTIWPKKLVLTALKRDCLEWVLMTKNHHVASMTLLHIVSCSLIAFAHDHFKKITKTL